MKVREKAPAASFLTRLLMRNFEAMNQRGEAESRRLAREARARRRFARHHASCFELPAAAYGPFSPMHFD